MLQKNKKTFLGFAIPEEVAKINNVGKEVWKAPHIIIVVSSIDSNRQYMDSRQLKTIFDLNCATEFK